jgi:hypothetical protein
MIYCSGPRRPAQPVQPSFRAILQTEQSISIFRPCRQFNCPFYTLDYAIRLTFPFYINCFPFHHTINFNGNTHQTLTWSNAISCKFLLQLLDERTWSTLNGFPFAVLQNFPACIECIFQYFSAIQ